MALLYYYELPDNTSMSAYIPITTKELPIASLSPYLQSGESVSLYSTIGWQATGKESVPKVRFTIWRGAPFTGTSICSFIDSCEADFDSFKVSNIAQVDTDFVPDQETSYVLTAQILNSNSSATIIGAFTFLLTVYQ